MTIYEPSTLLTDYLLTALGGWLAWRLHRRLPADNEAARWWGRALALIAAAAFVGGSSHGFGPNLPPAAAAALKTATLLTLSLVAAAMTLSLVYELAAPERRRRWLVLVGLKLGFFAALAVARPVFVVAIADYGLALVAWLVAALVCRRPWRGWMLAACGMSIIAALVQQLRWGLSDQFNHNDLYHVIQAGALYFFYRATLRLGEGVVAPNPPPLSAPAGVLQGAGNKGPPGAIIPPRQDCLDTGGRGRFIEIHHHENSSAFPFVGNVCLGHPAAGSDLDLRRWNQ